MAGTTRHEFGGVSCFFFNNDNIKNFGDPYHAKFQITVITFY